MNSSFKKIITLTLLLSLASGNIFASEGDDDTGGKKLPDEKTGYTFHVYGDSVFNTSAKDVLRLKLSDTPGLHYCYTNYPNITKLAFWAVVLGLASQNRYVKCTYNKLTHALGFGSSDEEYECESGARCRPCDSE